MAVVASRRKVATFRLPEELLEGLKSEAQRQHRSVNSLVEWFLIGAISRTPNGTTLAAMHECETGENLDELTPSDLENFTQYVASL